MAVTLRCFSVRCRYDKDRVHVYYQQVADQLPNLPEGKILVNALDYKPSQKQTFL